MTVTCPGVGHDRTVRPSSQTRRTPVNFSLNVRVGHSLGSINAVMASNNDGFHGRIKGYDQRSAALEN